MILQKWSETDWWNSQIDVLFSANFERTKKIHVEFDNLFILNENRSEKIIAQYFVIIQKNHNMQNEQQRKNFEHNIQI